MSSPAMRASSYISDMSPDGNEEIVRGGSRAPTVPPAVVGAGLVVDAAPGLVDELPAAPVVDALAVLGAYDEDAPMSSDEGAEGEEDEPERQYLETGTPLPLSPHPSWPGPTPPPPSPRPVRPPTLAEFEEAETLVVPLPRPADEYDPDVWTGLPANHLGHRLGTLPFPVGARWMALARFFRPPDRTIFFSPTIKLAEIVEAGTTLMWAAVPFPPPDETSKGPTGSKKAKGRASVAPSAKPNTAGPSKGKGKGKARAVEGNQEEEYDQSNPGEGAMLVPCVAAVGLGCACNRCTEKGVVCLRVPPHSCLSCDRDGKGCYFLREDATTDDEFTVVPHSYAEFIPPDFGWTDPRVIPLMDGLKSKDLASFWGLLNLSDHGVRPADLSGRTNYTPAGKLKIPPANVFPVKTRCLFPTMVKTWFGILHRGEPPQVAAVKRKRQAEPVDDEDAPAKGKRRRVSRPSPPPKAGPSSRVGRSTRRSLVQEEVSPAPAAASSSGRAPPPALPSPSPPRSRSATLVAISPRIMTRSLSRAVAARVPPPRVPQNIVPPPANQPLEWSSSPEPVVGRSPSDDGDGLLGQVRYPRMVASNWVRASAEVNEEAEVEEEADGDEEIEEEEGEIIVMPPADDDFESEDGEEGPPRPVVRSSVERSMTPLSPAGPSDYVPLPPIAREPSVGAPAQSPSVEAMDRPMSMEPLDRVASPVRAPSPDRSLPSRAPSPIRPPSPPHVSRPPSPIVMPSPSEAGPSQPRRRPYVRSPHLAALIAAQVESISSTASSSTPPVAPPMVALPVNESTRVSFARYWSSFQVIARQSRRMQELLFMPPATRPDDWEDQLQRVQITIENELGIQRIDLAVVSGFLGMVLSDGSLDEAE